jgi:hypothetical protein
MEIAAFVNPSGRDPGDRQAGELLGFIFPAARAGIGHNRHVRLIRDLKFLEHGAAIAAVIPDGNEIESYLRIVLYRLEPAAGFEFGLAVRAPRSPEMDHRPGDLIAFTTAWLAEDFGTKALSNSS